MSQQTENKSNEPQPFASLTCYDYDDLCLKMLSLGSFGGCEGGTDNLRASEIRALLVPFFGVQRIERCINILCGHNSQI